jgi:hypothetical protein
MFEHVDGDGSGEVDLIEVQEELSHMCKYTSNHAVVCDL